MRTRTGFAAVVVLSGVAVGAPQVEAQINKEFINPAGGFTQVVTVEDRGVKTVYLSENPPAATLLGIQSLYSETALFEYEGIAVVQP